VIEAKYKVMLAEKDTEKANIKTEIANIKAEMTIKDTNLMEAKKNTEIMEAKKNTEIMGKDLEILKLRLEMAERR
jgi:hypothetical protein